MPRKVLQDYKENNSKLILLQPSQIKKHFIKIKRRNNQAKMELKEINSNYIYKFLNLFKLITLYRRGMIRDPLP
jgi:hypothetical protein